MMNGLISVIKLPSLRLTPALATVIAFAAAALVAAARLAPEIAAFFFAFFTTIAVVVPVGLAFAAAAFLASRDLRRAAAFL